MRGLLLNLSLVLMVSGLVVAGSTSSIRTDFYVSALSADPVEQHFLANPFNQKSLVTIGVTISITLAIILTILKQAIKPNKKIKKARRKK